MATITTIQSTDLITNSRADINTNFANLNSDKIETSVIDTDTTLAANSDAKLPSQKAVKAYVDAGGNVNASTTAKGIVEEATAAETLAGSATGGTSARLFVNPSGLITSGLLKFGGTGADGALNVTSGTTNVDLGNAAVVTKNYTSINISNGATLGFTNPHASGTVIIIKCQGDVTIVGTIDASGMGSSGGTPSGNAGTAPTAFYFHGSDTMYGAGGLAAGAGQSTGGPVPTNSLPFITTTTTKLNSRTIYLVCGAGGGSGASNGTDAGGAGGRGGGTLLIQCGGSLNFTGTISVAGAAGSSTTSAGGRAGSGAGGGGGGGMLLVLYNSLTANSGTVNANGGNGGDSTAAGTTGNPGGGGAGGGSVNGAGGNGAATTAGGAGNNGIAGTTGGGGGGASGKDDAAGTNTGGSGGATTTSIITTNLWFA